MSTPESPRRSSRSSGAPENEAHPATAGGALETLAQSAMMQQELKNEKGAKVEEDADKKRKREEEAEEEKSEKPITKEEKPDFDTPAKESYSEVDSQHSKKRYKVKTFDDPEQQEKLEAYRRKKRERQKKYREQKKAEASIKGEDAPDKNVKEEAEKKELQGPFWEVDHIPLTVAKTLDSDETEEINFAETIGVVDGKKMRWVQDQQKVYLPKEYNENTREYRQRVLAPMFSRACAVAGSKVLMYGWEPLKGNAKFGCYRCRTRHSKIRNDDSTSAKPRSSEDVCRFSFHVYWDEEVNRWYIKQRGAGCRTHSGHGPIADREELENESRRRAARKAPVLRGVAQKNAAYLATFPVFSEVTSMITTSEDTDRLKKTLEDFKDTLPQAMEEEEKKPEGVDVPIKDEAPVVAKPETIVATTHHAMAAV